jgi:hypothetical protein
MTWILSHDDRGKGGDRKLGNLATISPFPIRKTGMTIGLTPAARRRGECPVRSRRSVQSVGDVSGRGRTRVQI